MSSMTRAIAAAAFATMTAALPSDAHHVWAVDNSRTVEITGTVTGFNWGNPHVQIFLDLQDTAGKVERWTAGGPSPTRMAGTGWSKDTVKVGEVITAIGHRATDQPNLLRIQKVKFANGREMDGYGAR